MDRPAAFFPKRNSSGVVVRRRPSIARTTATPTTSLMTIQTTELPKITRRVTRRKIQKNPSGLRKVSSTTTTTTQNYEQFSDVIDDDIASVLPAITSAKPRRPSKPILETTPRAFSTTQQNKIEAFVPKFEPKQSYFDELVQHQNAIKGIDVNSGENYEDNERLIGVLGSQVKISIFCEYFLM